MVLRLLWFWIKVFIFKDIWQDSIRINQFICDNFKYFKIINWIAKTLRTKIDWESGKSSGYMWVTYEKRRPNFD